MTADSNALCGMTLRGVRVTMYRLMTSAGIIFLATNVMKCQFLITRSIALRGTRTFFKKGVPDPLEIKKIHARELTLCLPNLQKSKVSRLKTLPHA